MFYEKNIGIFESLLTKMSKENKSDEIDMKHFIKCLGQYFKVF